MPLATKDKEPGGPGGGGLGFLVEFLRMKGACFEVICRERIFQWILLPKLDA